MPNKESTHGKESTRGKENSGGGPKKPGKEPRVASQDSEEDLSEAQDRKRNNIGPSGQGTHRGRERKNDQSPASGRPDVSGNN